MKYYDKNLSKTTNNIKTILLVLVLFCLGFFAGYVVGGGELMPTSDNQTNNVIQSKK